MLRQLVIVPSSKGVLGPGSQKKHEKSLVRPYMKKTMSVTSINLISIFIIKEGSDVLQSLCH